jgi:hypothetical protein
VSLATIKTSGWTKTIPKQNSKSHPRIPLSGSTVEGVPTEFAAAAFSLDGGIVESSGVFATRLGSRAGATATAVPVDEALVAFGAMTPAPHFTQKCESSGIFAPHLRQNIWSLPATDALVLLRDGSCNKVTNVTRDF